MPLLIPAVIFSITAVLVCILLLRQKKQHKHRTKQCLQELADLKRLVILIQRHRGLSCGYLNGDLSLDESIGPLQQSLNQHWRQLEATHQHIHKDKLYQGIREHWSRLQEHWRKQVLDNNIEQHNRLILNLLYLIENEAERNTKLVRLSRTKGYDVTWKELLDTIETIGQTRATGMAVIASGECSAVARIKLKFLLDKGQSQLAQINEHVQKYRSDSSNKTIHSTENTALLTSAHSEVQKLFNCVEQQVIELPKQAEPRLNGKHFFDLASKAIEPLDQLFNLALEQLKAQI